MNTKLWQQYEEGLTYQRQMGFRENFPKFIRFKEGDQWPAPTIRTRNLPRPVFNIVEMFIRTKRASVLSQPVRMTFFPGQVEAARRAEAEQAAQDLTDYAQQLWDRTEQDTLNSEMVDDAATLGTGILHYYFDPTACSAGPYPDAGEIRGESIDPLNIVFGNPQERDVQKQPYLLIASRRSVREVREMARQYGVSQAQIDSIGREEATQSEEYDAARMELRGEDRCTLLTRYYRKNGVVYFDRAVRSTDLVHGVCLSPKGRTPITLYPVVVMPWKPRKKCIFGIGEAEGLLPNQKAINFNLAMMLLSVQQTAWPKLLSTPGAIKQPVTNEPGEHLIDYSAGGSGIRYLNPPAFGATAMNLSTIILELSRTIAGVSEVSTGEMTGTNMAASAIIALQTQAKAPIQEIQRRYWNVIRQIGRIWLELIRTYYVLERSISVRKNGETETRTFRGSSYGGMDFDLTVDAGPSNEYGEVISQSVLDRFLDQGYITFDQYIELAPDGVIPFREKLRQLRAGEAVSENHSDSAAQEEGPSVHAVYPAGVEGVSLPGVLRLERGGKKESR